MKGKKGRKRKKKKKRKEKKRKEKKRKEKKKKEKKRKEKKKKEKKRKEKKRKGKKRLATVSMDRRLHSRQGRLTVFPTPLYCSPLWLRGPLPFGLYPHAPLLFHTAIAITFLLCLVPAFFLFSPFILNLCRTMSTVISPSLPPPLACTLAIPCCHCHQPCHCHLNTTATSPIL